MSTQPDDLDTSQIKNWRSIVTLVVFVLTNIALLGPFHITVFIPRFLSNPVFDLLSSLRIIPESPGQNRCYCTDPDHRHSFVRFNFPMNFITAPLIADLFLLAISAVGRKEVYDSTIGLGADSFSPIDIVAFFITLAYITISIDASGLIRYLSFCMLRWGDGSGHRLFIYLNTFFFGLGSIIGDDTAIMSCAAFLAYMTRVSSNIIHPRAWIHTQFAIAKISSTIMVSSNPTNLILVGAFNIKFIRYTANVVVPVVVTAIVLFPFLLYIVFAEETLIPLKIEIHMLTPEEKAKTPVNLNIPDARGVDEERGGMAEIFPLEEIMNPFLDPKGAAFGVLIVTATLVIILVMNSQSTGQHPVYWVTLPAAFVMFCWDITSGWVNRHETREIARKGRREKELFRAEQTLRKEEEAQVGRQATPEREERHTGVFVLENDEDLIISPNRLREDEDEDEHKDEKQEAERGNEEVDEEPEMEQWQRDDMARREQLSREVALRLRRRKRGGQIGEPQITLADLTTDLYRWSQETFPTATAVLTHLPFALVPFIFSMFLLVQALVTRRWVLVFAYGWDHWVNKTGTVGAVGGMGFVSIILCNFAGTNIGATILLSRVIQAWQTIHQHSGIPISDRNFWATVYSMALGVNYGAFSLAATASLSGLLWQDILARKRISVRAVDFCRVNLPIIACAMAVGCTILVGEVYIIRDRSRPYDL